MVEENNNYRFLVRFIFYIFIILILIIILINLFDKNNIIERIDLYSSFNVSKHVGFDLNSSAITFGLVQPGYSASRNILIDNGNNFPVFVSILSNGEISNYLVVSDNDFVLGSGEFKKLGFSVYPSENLDYKFIDGQISIIFKKV